MKYRGDLRTTIYCLPGSTSGHLMETEPSLISKTFSQRMFFYRTMNNEWEIFYRSSSNKGWANSPRFSSSLPSFKYPSINDPFELETCLGISWRSLHYRKCPRMISHCRKNKTEQRLLPRNNDIGFYDPNYSIRRLVIFGMKRPRVENERSRSQRVFFLLTSWQGMQNPADESR